MKRYRVHSGKMIIATFANINDAIAILEIGEYVYDLVSKMVVYQN